MMRPSRRVIALALWTLVAGACAREVPRTTTSLDDGAVTVGSFNFPESVLLAELYAQALEAEGIRVVRQLDLGTRELVEPALERGLVELVPEYAGSLANFLTGSSVATADLGRTREALERALGDRDLAALEPSPAQDQNAFAVTRETAERLGIDSLTDLAEVGVSLTFGGPPECPQRPLCLPGLSSVYGLTFSGFVPLDEGGPVTVEALVRGHVDVALVFSTGGTLSENELVLLDDDRGLQPAENVTPVLHGSAIERFGPTLVDALNAVSAALTTEELRAMNSRMAEDGSSPATLAREWLSARGLLLGSG